MIVLLILTRSTGSVSCLSHIVMSNYFLLITNSIPSNILRCLLTTSPLLQARDPGHVSQLPAPHVSRLPSEIMDKFSGQTREVGGYSMGGDTGAHCGHDLGKKGHFVSTAFNFILRLAINVFSISTLSTTQ